MNLQKVIDDLAEALKECRNAYGCVSGCTAGLDPLHARDHTPTCLKVHYALAQAHKAKQEEIEMLPPGFVNASSGATCLAGSKVIQFDPLKDAPEEVGWA